MEKSILKKLRGYKSQDDKFEIFSSTHFIKADQVLEKLNECNNTCYYCNEPLKMEYSARDMKQWTLDRIDNTMGHNTSNVLISCLECNLKRRNRSVKKFLFTKQLSITKLN
jgi:hypothetical protein